MPERDLALEAAATRVAQDAVARLRLGGPIAAALRALVYVLGGEKSVDERAFAVLVQIAANSPALQKLGFGGFRDLLRDQQMIMRLEPERGLDVMPDMLADADMEARASGPASHKRALSLPAGRCRRMDKRGSRRFPRCSRQPRLAPHAPVVAATSRGDDAPDKPVPAAASNKEKRLRLHTEAVKCPTRMRFRTHVTSACWPQRGRCPLYRWRWCILVTTSPYNQRWRRHGSD